MSTFGDERLPARFWDKAQVVAEASRAPGPCWVWTGWTTAAGYGVFTVDGRGRTAHRVAYAALVDPALPLGGHDLEIDHLCLVKACVNPGHLEAVTARENGRRSGGLAAQHAARTHCPSGHEYTPGNTWRYEGRRYCRTCRRRAR